VQRNWGGLSVIPANATNATNLPTQNPQLPIPSLTQRAMILSPQLKLTDGSWQRCVIWSNDELSDSVQRLSQLCINLNDPFTSSQMESKRDAALSEHLNPLEASGFSLKKFHQQLESMEFLNSESDPDYVCVDIFSLR
jgi:hypothetical protein